MRVFSAEAWRARMSRVRTAMSGVARSLAAFLRRWDKDALARAEGEARRAERRLHDAIDILPEGLVFLDGEGRYILWNKRYAEMYHRSADLFAPGRRLADTLRIGVARGDYPDAVGREDEWIANRLALLQNPGMRHEQKLSDGRWVMIEERGTSDGGIIGLRVDITDMKEQAETLRKALVRAEAANRSKSDFLANMSHEIRTPLNGVLGLADVLAHSPLGADQRDIVSTIIASANTLDALLSDLLDFARLESGRVELSVAPFGLRKMVEETAALFAPELALKGLILELGVSADANIEVLGDEARLRQILTNLLSNAVKFTTEGTISVRLRAEGSGETRLQVIEVADTGIGFDPDEAERLFRRFEQADSSITRRYGGTGLGLAICRQLIGLMGGTIVARSRPGRGASFTVELPLPIVAKAASAEPPTPASAHGLRILVAEDNPTNRKVAELMLGSLGAEVECVENGQEAVDALRLGGYDVAFIDLQMPVMDGLTAIRTVRAEEAGGGRRRMPLIVLSANVMPEHLEATKAAGADIHIGKPVRASELLSAIVTVLSEPAAAPAAIRALRAAAT